MSTWNLGIDDVSEETRAFRDKLASKDAQIIAQNERLSKQEEEFEELQRKLNETLHKLDAETKRALQLETDLQQRSEDLRNERIASENAKNALTSAQEKHKATNLEMRQLETTLEKISHTSDEHSARAAKLEREKAKLDARIKELEANLHQANQSTAAATPGRGGPAHKPRSSSLSGFRITTLEQDLLEVRTRLAKKEAELETSTQRLAQVQNDLMKAENDKVAAEKKSKADLEELRGTLEEKEEELTYLREQQGDSGREEELLRRIDEDEAKIAALELMIRNTGDAKELQDKLSKLEVEFQAERRRVQELDSQCAELAREKEEALDELDRAQEEARAYAKKLQDRKEREKGLKEKVRKSLALIEDPLMGDDGCLIDMETLEPSSTAPTRSTSTKQPEVDMDTVSQMERLLNAVDRLRHERDTLRRDLQFVETESKFAIEALEAKLAASASPSSNEQTMHTIEQLRAEMDEMHAQFVSVTESMSESLRMKNLKIRELRVQVEALTIVVGHAASVSDDPDLSWTEDGLSESQSGLKELEERYEEMSGALEAMTNERNELYERLRHRDDEWQEAVESLKMDEQDAQERLEQAMCELAELNNHIDNVESERDSLTLQVTNLTADLQLAQEELTQAESRYTNLQFHQLSNMTSSEATRTLRDHIEELEGRVLRRNEAIGILQHDVRRLDTNLRLQEERLVEMTAELEMITAQKDAMVEDCADAREARDTALFRVEKLEDEMEILEDRVADDQNVISGLITVIADTVSRARYAIRVSSNKAEAVSQQEHLELQRQLDEKIRSLMESTKRSEEHAAELQKVRLALEQCQTEAKELSQLSKDLQAEKEALETKVTEAQEHEQGNEKAISDLQKLNHDLQERIQAMEQAANSTADDSEDVTQLKVQHAQALATLQQRLAETETTLEQLQAKQVVFKEDHRKVLEEHNATIVELQEQLESANKELSDLQQLKSKQEESGQADADKLSTLEADLKKVSEERDAAVKSLEELEQQKQTLADELARVEAEKEELESNYSTAQKELERKVQSMEGRFEEELRLSAISKEEVGSLTIRLQQEVEARSRDREDHEAALAESEERLAQAARDIDALRSTLADVQKKVEETETALSESEDVKISLQEQITSLEAEVQKSKSLHRYTETQIKENTQLVATLKADVERLQAELANSEKACKAAEMKFSLQSAQHKRETADFQREISALKARPDLQQALAELEERNNEMDEILRAKCAEIEENDDRVLEMLKEKKKLSAKVETLNRKVLNLQAKLAAAKATSSAPAASERQPSSTPPKAVQPIAPTPSAPAAEPAYSRPRSATTSSTVKASPSTAADVPRDVPRTSLSRVVSGPSSLPRPKTPERNRPIAAVFRARTPEHRMVPESAPLPSAVVIGKKRAAPDDFDVCENLPAQAFTADGEDVENKTPRVRRVLNSLQSGFTPVRHQNNSRPTIGMPSPRRSAAARTSPPQISDMTNSPFQNIPPVPQPSASKQPPVKRSWLGKIRGQPSDKASVKSLFDRGEGS
ncbi:hypothetical protein CPC08DRAFT_680446 [Agrocybe pediades]|nr:hypothetical protein CPC08DRAFT_680446 [Agrocybe pediades]